MKQDFSPDLTAMPLGSDPDDPIQFLKNLIREQGDVARFDSAYGPAFFFNHPDQVQAVLHGNNFVRTSLMRLLFGDGLLASEGEHWLAQRRMAQPHFHESCMPAFIPAIVEATQAMLRRWDESCPDGVQVLDMSVEMRRVTLEIIARAFFSTTFEGEAAEWDGALTTLIEDIGAISCTQFNVPFRFTPSHHARFQKALQLLDHKVHRMIEIRRGMEQKPHDYLSTLLQKQEGRSLDDRQIRDEIVTLLIAGHETTAIALGWVWHVLAEHEVISGQVSAEAERVLGDGNPAMESLSQMPCTCRVLEETMRLYPPIWVTSRQTVVETELAGCRIPPKTLVLISAYTTHRHPDFWDDPERFDPRRFEPERDTERHRYAYFPFAGGRHVCMGKSFAMIEGQIILGLVLARWRIRAAPSHRAALHPAITLRQRGGLRMTVERRRPHLPVP